MTLPSRVGTKRCVFPAVTTTLCNGTWSGTSYTGLNLTKIQSNILLILIEDVVQWSKNYKLHNWRWFNTTSLFPAFCRYMFQRPLSPSSALLQLSESSTGLQMSVFNGFMFIKEVWPRVQVVGGGQCSSKGLLVRVMYNGGFCPWNLQGSCEGLTRTSKE